MCRTSDKEIVHHSQQHQQIGSYYPIDLDTHQPAAKSYYCRVLLFPAFKHQCGDQEMKEGKNEVRKGREIDHLKKMTGILRPQFLWLIIRCLR